MVEQQGPIPLRCVACGKVLYEQAGHPLPRHERLDQPGVRCTGTVGNPVPPPA